MPNGKILSMKTLNSALHIDYRKLVKKANMSGNPSKSSTSTNEGEDDEVESYIQRVKLAAVKAAIFAGNAVFAGLLGIGGATIVIPEIGRLIMANPQALLVGSVIVFFANFFLKLKTELNINGKE